MLTQLSPQFSNDSYTSVFNQNLLTGDVVLSVACNFDGTVRYELPETVTQVMINPLTGDISLTVDALNFNNVSTSVICFDSENDENRNIALIYIYVIEENAHRPTITHPSLTVSFSEDTPVNSYLVDINATDDDLGMFGMIQFSIPAGNDLNLFVIDMVSGLVSLNKPLDFERAVSHQILVRASNLPDPRTGNVETATRVVVIIVQDVDDTPPAFETSTYEIVVPETVLSNSIAGMNYPRPLPGFLITKCTDVDTPSEQISYSIVSERSIYPLILNTRSGSFSVAGDLDYETRTSFTFDVVCYDNSLINSSDMTLVNLAVSPVNEAIPDCDADTLSSLSFPETTAVGAIIATANPNRTSVSNTYSCTDIDDGPDGNVTFSLDETRDSLFFSLDLISGDLTISEVLDCDDSTVIIFGTVRLFRLSITGCDEFPPSSRCSNFEFLVFVQSVNEFDPIIAQRRHNLHFSESFPSGGLILSASDVSCTDQDRGRGELDTDHFRIFNPSDTIAQLFRIDSRNGAVTLRENFDYEREVSYGFEIECYDNDERSDKVPVSVLIEPENDNLPAFNPRNYIFNVSRTTPPSTIIGYVHAQDADIDLGGNLHFSVQSNGFVDVTEQGELLLFNSVLNISETTISFFAYVNDEDTSYRDDVLVFLQLTEGNSARPRFVTGSAYIEVSELVMPGEIVRDVMCVDSDTGLNGQIRYSFTSGNVDEAFSIDMNTGRISVNNILILPDNSEKELYTISLECEDMGVPIFSDDATVFITVFKDDSNPPVISNNTINLFISEDTPINTLVATIQAIDIDSQELDYRLENQSSPGTFSIDTRTGGIEVIRTLDREVISQYYMTVIVTKVRISIGPERSDSAVVNIFIRDVNDNEPVCTSPSYVVDVDETAPVGERILLLQCSDSDLEANGQLTYALLNEMEVLAIDATTGEITVANYLNGTNQTVLNVQVEVADNGSPDRQRIIVQVSVFIFFSNRNQPLFTNLPSVINVSEARILQDIIFSVMATDSDRGSFGKISYGIVGDERTTFGIFSNTGGLFLNSKLNFFDQSQYVINITARDSDFTVSATLTVFVLDANEFSPICEPDQQRFVIPESVDPSEISFQRLLCSDDDLGTNGELFYDIESGNDGEVFRILDNGTVTILRALNYEDIQQYHLLINVSDRGFPPASILKRLEIIVDPVNEYAPIFEQDSYAQSVVEGTAIGTDVLLIVATDRDSSLHVDGQIVYSILGLDENFFTITSNGRLQVTDELNREVYNSFSFTIQATDLGIPALTSTTSINISILDIDDNPPRFTEELYLFVVNDSAVQGRQIGAVNCIDLDAGNNSIVTYSFDLTENDVTFFTIRNTGVIESQQDLSVNSIHTFTVHCTGPPPLNRSDSTTVNVRVLLDTTITFFPSNVYVESIREDTLPVIDIVILNGSSSTGATLTYRQLNLANQFDVDDVSGVVRLIAPLDFELTESYSLRIEATDGGNPPVLSDALVQIEVININDENPVIITEPLDIFVEEGPINSTQVLEQYQCLDGDNGPLGEVTFKIVGGNTNEKFSISSSGILSLVSDLDNEVLSSYSLEIVCQDGGQPPRLSSVSVSVIVVPINDNSPRFTTISDVSVVENLPIGTNIGTAIGAIDMDTFPHNIIRYTISSGNTIPATFAISTISGQLTLQRSLDYEDITEYSLGIQIDDSGGLGQAGQFPIFSTSSTVTIRVLDVNDNSPMFSARFYFGTIDEAALVGDLVNFPDAPVCTDEDAGPNGDIVFSVDEGVPFNVQSNGAITVAGSLDYETMFSHRLNLYCSDPDQTERAFLLIILTDTNEYGPEFVAQIYSFTVAENSAPGILVGTVDATDRDSTQEIVYSFASGESPSEFTLDSNSGNIILQENVDFEIQQQYSLTVRVEDSVGRIDMALVDIQIENLNDNSPRFIAAPYFQSIRENAVIGSPVGGIHCSDADNEAEGIPLNYTITTDGVPFEIDGSGIIGVSGDIDLEEESRYTIKAQCIDSGGLNITVDVTIDILPFNDFPPQFIFPSGPANTFHISEGIRRGDTVLRVIAVDRDIINYNTIIYTIVEGNEGNYFSLDRTIGYIRLERDVDREEQALYVLNLKAENVIPHDDDSGSLPLSSNLELTIVVDDLNDNFPTINPSDPQPVMLVESNSSFIDIAFFVCSDPDDGANGRTHFSISSLGLADNFEISEDGVVRTISRISTSVILDITCSDFGMPPRSTTVSLAVNSITANEHSPVFPMTSYTLMLPEDYPLNTDFLCLNATDMDGPDNPDGILKYSLLIEHPQDDFSRFSIRQSTGCLFVGVRLNYDVSSLYIYQVTASDTGDEPLSVSVQVRISIQDTIPVPPTFENTPYQGILIDNEESGTQVAQVICSDIDQNDNVTYSITAGNSQAIFQIDSALGSISLASDQTVDYEISTVYFLTVSCIDTHNLQATTIVTLTVLPINEYTPTFISGPFSIEENAILGTVVTELQYFDGDDGLDGEVSFNLINSISDDAFSLLPNGQISVNGNLDREILDFYSFQVEISDLSINSTHRRSSSNLVNITILDQNDNRPEFEFDTYTFGPLAGDETPGFVVGVAVCTDLDLGENSLVTYSVVESSVAPSLFNVQPTSGELFVSGDLSTRRIDDIVFFIQCADSGVGMLTDMSRVLVRVTEVNRNAPEFSNSSYTVQVLEDAEIFNDVIVTLTANDRDTGINGQVRYALENNLDLTFFINEDTGEIILLRSLDFEMRTVYLLVVEARDGATDSTTQMLSRVNVTIEVIGVNEFPPQCVDPIYTAIINRTTLGNVIDFECSDDDIGPDGTLTYQIVSGDINNLFSVSENGILTVPNFISPGASTEQTSLNIVVSDGGSSPRQTEIEAIIIYSYDNLNSPSFELLEYNFNVTELIAVGVIIGNASALDSDPGLQGQITYSISGTPSFRVDPRSGDLFVGQSLDWETTTVHTFSLIAQDRDPFSPRQGTATVTVTVSNENDNLPQCSQVFYSIEIQSNASIGDTLLSLDCEDPDQTPIQYEIESIMPSQLTMFAIEGAVGRIYVSESLIPFSNILFRVFVIGNELETIEVTMNVVVRFINTLPPVFSLSEFVIQVAEDSPLLSVIGVITATDMDSKQSDLIYSISDSSKFFINPSTGDVVLTLPLDFESTQEYFFIVNVMDFGSYDGSNKLRSSANLTVNVTNVNDNSPVFNNNGLYGASVSETSAVETVILSIICEDNDSPPYGSPDVTSSNLVESPFSLMQTVEGAYVIEVSSSLSGPSSYIFNMSCTDDGGLETDGQVYIFVPESLAAEFTQPLYEWFLSENAKGGDEYTLVQASSNDGSSVTYSITDGNGQSIFYINPTSGAVSLVTSVDYETQQSHVLIVRATDGKGRQTSVLMIVRVLDENDEIPLIPPSTLLSVGQNSLIGSPIGVLVCTDRDTIDSAISFSFSFTSDSQLFSVDEFGIVRLEGVLSDTPVYSLPVVCFDLNHPEDMSMGVVTIEVEFVNLNHPVFNYAFYTFFVREDVEPLTFVGQVLAIDEDVGSFGAVAYTIIDGNPNHFFIETSTGQIGVLTSLDREMTDSYTLTIVAYDGGISAPSESRLNQTVIVEIFVEDVNDNPPMPMPLYYVQSISTNHSLLEPVLSVVCLDPDLLTNGIVEYSLEPESLEDFVIQHNGTLLLAREQTNQAVYNLFVVCTDRGDPSLSSSALVVVTVDFISLSAPVFDQEEYIITVIENVPIGSSVLQVHAESTDSSSDVIYRITGGNDLNRFQVNPLSGIILVTDELDASVQQLFVLTISATSTDRTALSSLSNVIITITDINDNSPQFSMPFYLANVTEHINILTPIVQVNCADADVIADISYSIQYSLDLFSITREGLIVVGGDIDFEANTSHAFEVICTDGGDAPQLTTTSVRIEVLPLNEFIPVFSQTEYNFTTSENGFGALIGQLEAVDDDAGSQGFISYFLQDPNNNSVVLVNSETGEVLVANFLDYEVQTSWDLTVIARDGAGAESHTLVHIDVENVNDVQPVISPSTAIFTIDSNNPVGFPIQSFTCSDADGSQTSLFINSGNTLGLFELDSNGILSWTGQGHQLDANAVISLNIICEDRDSPVQTALGHIAIRIQVTDAPPPVFTEAVYMRNISESSEVGTVVLTITATSDSMNITYSLFNLPTSFPFGIDAVSGEVTLDIAVNREDGSLYTFFVGATDLDTLGVGIVLVEVRVEDANDNTPIIFPKEQTVTLRENFAVATEFIRFLCTDSDLGANGQIGFELASQNTSNPFSISQINSGIGSVSLRNILDFEIKQQYTLVVKCVDRGVPPLTASAILIVIVSSVNEFAPTFSQEDYIFHINETSEAGYVVGTVTATDMDEGIDGIFEYHISPTSNYQHFTINSIGEIRTSSLRLNASVNDQLRISILAVDKEGLSGTSFVTFNINDINSAPVFSDFGNYFVLLSSNQTTPSTILEFFCYDTDISGNADLYLSTVTIPSIILIETESTPGLIGARLILNESLSAGAYDLPLTCSDRGSPGLLATAIATVQIQGMNTAPTFDHGPVFFSVLENVARGTYLFAVNASDTENNVIYAITGGSGRGVFNIDSNSGLLSVSLPLDYEITPNYLLTVTAYDQSVISQLAAHLQVSIDVININDEYPIIRPPGIQQIAVSETEQPGFVVVSYNCTDPDGSQPVMFSSLPLSPDFSFSQRQNTADMLLESVLNFTIESSYEFSITCTDREVRMGGFPLSTTVTLIVNVLPSNTHPPQFLPHFNFSVSESTLPGVVIGNVSAFDPDGRGKITYSLISHSDIFVVDHLSGQIILFNPLDYETGNLEYSLLIEASDNDVIQGVSPLTSSVTVTIHITDVNDNVPICQSLITSMITIGTHSFFPLAQLVCSDVDSGDNSALVYGFAEPLPSIENGDFVINASTGEVGFQGDIAVPGALVITVLVSNLGDMPQQTNVTIVVIVMPSDSSSIRFDPNTFNVSIFENVAIGSEILNSAVLQAALINPIGNDAVFSLQYITENSRSFIIDPVSGSISVIDNTPLDFESDRESFLLIIDAVVGSLGGTAVIKLSLLDVNDNSPTFEQALFTANISENQPANTFILKVAATDADSTSNAAIAYSIEGSIDFYIEPDSGVIRSSLPLDRETNSLYSFSVIARDFGTPSLTGSALVTVDVQDLNDVPPVFASSLYILSINNLSPPLRSLLSLEVTDNDITNDFTYWLITSDANVQELFAVDEFNGMISRGSREFPIDHSNMYSFTVGVYDGNSTDMTLIIIYVASATTDSIVFRENIETEEYDLKSFLILQDFEIFPNTTYVITEGDANNEFVLSPTGILTTRNALDRENTPEYTLMIHVENPPSTNDVDVFVTVRVQDMNDNSPTFSSNEYLFCVPEGTYQDRFLIGVVFANDIDQIDTNAATIEYSLVGAIYGTSDKFEVSPETGEVFVKQTSTLDRERYENHTLVIRARDFGEPGSLVSQVLFVVCLNDTNDNDPEFVPVDVVEYVILLGKAEVSRDTVLDNIIAILPKGIQLSQSVFMFSDRDTTSTVTADLRVIGTESKFKLTQNITANTATLVLLDNIREDTSKSTILQIALSDETNEDNYIVRNVSLIFDSKFEVPPTDVLSSQPPFFQTDVGIAVIVIISMIIVALLVFFLCMCCYCYMRYKWEKDPLNNR